MGANGDISLEAMREHLSGVLIGFRPGDPDAGQPLPAMPQPLVPPPPGMKTIDLRQTSMAELHAEAAATQPRDLFAALLPDPPGVPPGRIAYVTGREPQQQGAAGPDGAAQQQQRQQRRQAGGSPAAKLSDAELVAVLQRYLPTSLDSGKGGGGGGGGARRPGAAAAAAGDGRGRQPIPWAELGQPKGGPSMGGLECDLQHLWRLVFLERSGYEAVSAAGGWTDVARGLGADLKLVRNANFLSQQWYRRFLLPYEQHLRAAQGRQGGGVKKKAAAAAARDAEDAGASMP